MWSRPESGLLFGYALAYDEAGALDFFEQARIEGGPLAIFNAYPGGAGPTAFIEENRGENSVTFVNAAHDYPQRIMYTRRGGRMAATISRMDGTQAHTWTLRKC